MIERNRYDIWLINSLLFYRMNGTNVFEFLNYGN